MCNALVLLPDAMSSINFTDAIKAISSMATAVIAFLALKNWKRQDKAKRETEFLDAFIEATHTYIVEINKPITLLEMIKIGMASYAPTWENGNDEDVSVKGAIAYIEKNGERDGKRMLEVLEVVQNSTTKLRSLIAKGQVFNFNDYVKCHEAVMKLTWHFDRIEALMAIISSSTWNWKNPEVLLQLKNVMAIDPEDMRKSVQENNVTLLEFAQKTYKQIYG